MLTPAMQAILSAEAEAKRLWPKDLPGQRLAGNDRARLNRAPPSADLEVRDTQVQTGAHRIPVRIIAPRTAAPKPLMLFVHGGAFIAGSPQQASPVAERLAILTGSVVVSVGYRLAPEHPFPAGLDDCTAVLGWLARAADDLNGDRRRIRVVGISAGANLAVGAIQNAGVQIEACALVYGVFGTRTDTESHQAFGTGAFGLSTARLHRAFDLYLPIAADRASSDASPLNADLSGFPPTCLIAAQCDPLKDDSVQFYKSLLAHGVACSLHEYRGMAHGFINHFATLAEAGSATQRIADHFCAAPCNGSG